MSIKKPLKIGFDLDGVILYNPARIIRPIISLLKKRKIIQRKELQFFVPQSSWQKAFWRLFHKSSLFIAPGLEEIEKLVKQGKVEAYIVTGRFDHLQEDTFDWFKKFKHRHIFKDFYMNDKNEQPHLFKERKIKELKLDYFVEDNWDIVRYLSEKQKTPIIWMSNLFDRKISFSRKFFSLQSFVRSGILQKQKLLFLTDYYTPHWTGLSKSFYFLIQALQKENDCTVLTVQHRKDLPTKEKKENHSIIRVPFLFSMSRAKIAPQLLSRFIQEVKNTDQVILNSPSVFIFPLSLLTKIYRKKLKIFHQGDLILPKSFFNIIIEWFFNVFSFLSFFLANKLATYTNDYAKNSRLLQFFPQKTNSFVIPFSFEQKTKKKLNTLQDLRKKYRFIFGLSGRFVEEKGFDILFQAIPLIVKKNPAIHFVFAGEKNMGYENFFEKNKELYESVKQHITFLGLLQGENLESFYFSLDALVMPSRSDCFGLVQAEAMKYQKPVVVTDIIGARDVVTQTHFGEKSRKEDPLSLARSILTMTKNISEYKKHFPAVKKYFDFEKNTEKLKAWINSPGS